MKSIVLALGIRRAFSGRFKLLLNWSKGLNSLLINYIVRGDRKRIGFIRSVEKSL